MLDLRKIKIISFVSLLLSVPMVVLLTCKLQAQNTRNSSNGQIVDFVVPSGNIYCALIGKEKEILRCEIKSMLNPLPPQPYSHYCEFDWGAGFLLRRQGKPEILCISDTIAGSSHTLSYEKNWINSGFKCISKRTGLICNNSEGHGFFLSRNKWNVF